MKSIVFRAEPSGAPVLVLVSGANRVDEAWMSGVVAERLGRADPEFVRSVTGFAIGGVPPVGHPARLRTVIDRDLLELSEVWAAAGHPHAVCRLSSRELLELVGGTVASVTPVTPAGPTERWVTFDCYGTLVDWRAGFVRAAVRLGLADSPAAGDRLFRAYLEAERDIEGATYRSYRDVVAETVERAVRSVGGHVTLDTARQLPESIPEWPAFSDVPESLDSLRRQGLRIGILSNIDRDLLAGTFARQGISADAVVTAEDVRSYKPGPPHWIRFLKSTGAEPRDVVHVSASYEYDLETAAALGFPTVYVARYVPLDAARTVSHQLTGLSGLPSCPPVARLGARP